jgi:hypothetical protein
MNWLNIRCDSGVTMNDSSFCDKESKNCGDDDEDNHVVVVVLDDDDNDDNDGDDNGNYRSTRSVDIFCAMKPECLSPVQQITSLFEPDKYSQS